MTMTPEVATLRIGRSVKSVEDAMDELLARSGELLAEMARARVATAEAAHTGQRPMMRIAAMQQNLVAARSDLVRAHADLSKLAETMDIPVSGCPEDSLDAAETGRAAAECAA
ncbi:hypothetical protein MTR62_14155 [Novosphingobium sp. 1949]|uniref:Uncharacterized protein n=1 Tax=Novosphingobium organovorum TaxID=2930092 RepID=A0ABT0BFK2_9SPHN|nr:hypothetical protein [Novosphingobium organovorum]MCJ2183827.1 hypothetical protein [Novosphingobium organovorum]